ncbi:MAG: hypothetical protein ACOY33_06005 [Pseudomonadota bacterium]
MSRLLPVAGLAAALLLNGCMSTTELLRASEEAPATTPASRLLVVGVGEHEQIRRTYETVFMAELAAAGLTGVASSDLVPSLAGLSMAELRERMQEFNDRAEAALHVQLVNLVHERTLSPAELPAEQAPAKRRVGGIDLTLNAPAAVDDGGAQLVVELEANLYALPTRRLLWTGITATREANDPADVARSHARALIALLQERGYLATGR